MLKVKTLRQCVGCCVLYLNDSVHLRLAVVLHVLQAGASLAGRGDRVTPPAAPRHRQVTVVCQLGDAFTDTWTQKNIKTQGQRKSESAAFLFSTWRR